MQIAPADVTFLIVACVLFFFLLCIAFVVIVDHKARLPGEFTNDPFSIVGMRRDHPVFAFVITTTLLVVIGALLAALSVALAEALGLTGPPPPGGLLARLENERHVERVRHFHNLAPRNYAIEGKKNVCFLCHGDYPHSRAPMIRTLLNMHTQFIACMTCHQDPDKIPESAITLRWKNFSGIATQGPPFGTDIDPATGALVRTDDYYSKITAYARSGSGETLLEYTADDPRTQEFAAVRTTLSDADRDAVKKRFHANVAPKGRFCTRCHTGAGAGFVPFRQLGFSERRARELTSVNIVGLVSKYRSFYLPLLTRDDAAPPPAVPPAARSGPGPREDMRAWWKRTYDTPRPAPAKPR